MFPEGKSQPTFISSFTVRYSNFRSAPKIRNAGQIEFMEDIWLKKKKRSSISLPWGSGVWGPGTMLVSGPHRQRHFFHLISTSQHLTFFELFLQNLPVLSFFYVYTIIIGKESKATEFGSCDLNHVIQFQCLWKKLTRKWPMQFPKINWLYFQTDIFLLVKENITREKQAKNNLVVPEVRCSRFTLKHLI